MSAGMADGVEGCDALVQEAEDGGARAGDLAVATAAGAVGGLERVLPSGVVLARAVAGLLVGVVPEAGLRDDRGGVPTNTFAARGPSAAEEPAPVFAVEPVAGLAPPPPHVLGAPGTARAALTVSAWSALTALGGCAGADTSQREGLPPTSR